MSHNRGSARGRTRPLTTLSAVAAAVFVTLVLTATPVSAHSLDSSTISLHTTESSAEASITVALDALDEALGTDHAAGDVEDADQIIAYLDEHLTVTGSDGSVWTETYSGAVVETVEGIASFSVDVAFDTGGGNTDDLAITYDAIIEAVSDHEAVVVLTDAEGDISTPGILTSSDTTIDIGSGAGSVAVSDMVRHGFAHVLDGADHLLFLTTLLLPAPLGAAARRWRRRDGAGPAVRKVVHVVTAFTLGHSLTLIASALGWVALPSRPVEVLIAASVAVSAVHAIRPLAARGEEAIAAGFGLIHGLAFAGILADLGLQGRTSLLALLAFNVGIELAQLLTIALVFPSLYAMSRTRAYPIARIGGALLALAAASGWAVERLALAGNPLAGLEDAAIGHPWPIVAGLAVVATLTTVVAGRTATGAAEHDAGRGRSDAPVSA